MRLLLFIFSLVLIIYFLSSPGITPYSYFTRLAESFISGKLYLTQNPTWLNELVPVDGKYYVVYPPMPAILLMPYVLLFGSGASQTIFSIILGSVNVVLVYLLARRLNFSMETSFLLALFFGFGTNHWYLASVGSAWFIAHIVALFFLLLALIETFGKRRLLLTGLLIGASFWSRTTIIFTLPFFYIYLWRNFWPLNKKHIYSFLILNSGIIFFIMLDASYNFLRFGNISPFSPYHLIPNIYNDLRFRDGFLNIKYIPLHIEAMFLKLPQVIDHFPFLLPSLYSTAIWFTSPALIFIFNAKKSLINISCWVAIITTFSVIFSWAVVGFAQFGYRFAQDIMPFLLILMGSGIGQKPRKWVYLLVALSIIVNFWGTILINKFNIFTI